jgi:hypothetical protein
MAYKLPDIRTCEVALAMDCSQKDSFSISARPHPTNPEKKVIIPD